MENKRQTLFLVLILIFIIILIFMMVFLIKNFELLKSDPIMYGIKHYKFDSCYCYYGQEMIKFPIENNTIENLKFWKNEQNLLKKVILLVQTQIILNPTLELDKDQYTTNELINLNVNFDSTSLLQEFNSAFYEFKVDDFEITKVTIDLSDNLSLNKKPNFPINVILGQNNPIGFVLKPHFQMDKPFIGPIHITCILNRNLTFVYQTKSIELNLVVVYCTEPDQPIPKRSR